MAVVELALLPVRPGSEAAFEAAVADDSPLDANARRSRAGLVARQVTLR